MNLPVAKSLPKPPLATMIIKNGESLLILVKGFLRSGISNPPFSIYSWSTYNNMQNPKLYNVYIISKAKSSTLYFFLPLFAGSFYTVCLVQLPPGLIHLGCPLYTVPYLPPSYSILDI